MSNWTWAEKLFWQHSSALTARGFTLTRVTGEEYWAVNEAELRQQFPPEVYFELSKLRPSLATRARTARAASTSGTPLIDHAIVRDGDALVALFAGAEQTPSSYRMQHSAVHPAYQRRGVYRDIVEAAIAYTAALGYDQIASDHAPSNNPVIIAKLSLGFHIIGMSIDAATGPSLELRYFHHQAALAAYQFRCGLATVTPELAAVGTGAYAALRGQMCAHGASSEA